MLNYRHWISEMLLYLGNSEQTAEDIERSSPEEANDKGCSECSLALAG